MGPGAPCDRSHEAVLRLVHPRYRRPRLRPARRRRRRSRPLARPARRVPAVSSRREGALAIVLHTHMPYVEGFGTWPFGEEWLGGALAGSYLPLLELATEAGIREQVRSGVRSHLRRFGDDWRGGFWLPECAHEPGLEVVLREAGARAVCVELTGLLGLGSAGQLRPLLADSGLVLVPVDRETMALVWSEDGYPAAGAYRDYHHPTVHHHHPRGKHGEPHDPDAARGPGAEPAPELLAP